MALWNVQTNNCLLIDERGISSIKKEMPIWNKPTLTIEEAASLYNIGEHKLRELTNSDSCTFVLYVGRKRLIKRKQFDDYLAKTFSI